MATFQGNIPTAFGSPPAAASSIRRRMKQGRLAMFLGTVIALSGAGLYLKTASYYPGETISTQRATAQYAGLAGAGLGILTVILGMIRTGRAEEAQHAQPQPFDETISR